MQMLSLGYELQRLWTPKGLMGRVLESVKSGSQIVVVYLLQREDL